MSRSGKYHEIVAASRYRGRVDYLENILVNREFETGEQVETSGFYQRIGGSFVLATIKTPESGDYHAKLSIDTEDFIDDAAITISSEGIIVGDDMIEVGAPKANEIYHLAIGLGGYNDYGAPWVDGLRGYHYFIKGGAWDRWTRVFIQRESSVNPVKPSVFAEIGGVTVGSLRMTKTRFPRVLNAILKDEFIGENGESLHARTAVTEQRWSLEEGKAVIRDGECIITPNAKLLTDIETADVAFATSFVATPLHTVSLLVRYKDRNNYYEVRLVGANQSIQAVEVVNGKPTTKGSVTLTGPKLDGSVVITAYSYADKIKVVVSGYSDSLEFDANHFDDAKLAGLRVTGTGPLRVDRFMGFRLQHGTIENILLSL